MEKITKRDLICSNILNDIDGLTIDEVVDLLLNKNIEIKERYLTFKNCIFEVDYCYDSARLQIYVEREETDAEFEIRKQVTIKKRNEEEARDRAIYEKLKLKYEGKHG